MGKLPPCPRCGSDVSYRYGKTANGKPRRLFLICARQFTVGACRREMVNRPTCDRCGRSMHVYMQNESSVRFRCSGYPACRTFLKMPTANLPNQVLFPNSDLPPR